MSVSTAFAKALAAHSISEDTRVGLAVSGGGDSIAMMHLAARHLDVDRLQVLTIDHGLRPEAVEEIALVQAQAKRLGLQHHLGHWTWDGVGNLQASARAGRWQTLCAMAAQHDLTEIWMGHTEDDQIETFLMRLARGSGVDGLSAMQAATERDRMRILRPLLDIPRSDLREWLHDEGLHWADDPSNSDTRFDRVRARQLADTLTDLGLTRKRILQTVDHMKAARVTLGTAAATLAREHLRESAGDLLVSASVFTEMDKDQNRRVLAAALGWINGHAFRPRFEQLLNIAETIANGATATLAGCLLSVEKDGMVRIAREAAATSHLAIKEDAQSAIWDQRWKILGSLREGMVIKALGVALKECPDWRMSGMPRTSLLASPAIWAGETLVAAPLAGFGEGWSAQIVADFHSSAFAIED